MAANNLSIETFRPVMVDYEARPDGYEVWDCMDERPPGEGDTVLASYNYYQTPAALYGIALDLAGAMEAYRSGSFTDKNQPVYELAADVNYALLLELIMAALHDACLAEGGAQKIAASTIKSRESLPVFDSARLFNPTVTSDQFTDSATITGRLLSDGYIAEPSVAGVYLRDGSHEHAAVPSARLKDVPHDSLGYLALWDAEKCFDVPEADARETRAYVVSMGALERLHGVLSRSGRYPTTRVEDFLANTAIRTANIQSHHLLGPDGKTPLPIVNDLP
jgi:hypothetical protein